MVIILMAVDIHSPMHFIPAKVSDLVKFILMPKKTGPFTAIKVLLETLVAVLPVTYQWYQWLQWYQEPYLTRFKSGKQVC